MRIDNPTAEEKQKIFNNIDNYLEQNYQVCYEKFLDLGVKTVRLICYSKDFIHFNFICSSSALILNISFLI